MSPSEKAEASYKIAGRITADLLTTRRNPMARVAGADIPDAKRVEIALTYIYGIGRTRSTQILSETKVN